MILAVSLPDAAPSSEVSGEYYMHVKHLTQRKILTENSSSYVDDNQFSLYLNRHSVSHTVTKGSVNARSVIYHNSSG